MNKTNCVSLEKSPKANVPGNIACYGMPVGAASARQASLLSKSQILLITNLSGSLWHDGKDNPLHQRTGPLPTTRLADCSGVCPPLASRNGHPLQQMRIGVREPQAFQIDRK